jgi:outer membrane protein TolC
MASQVTPANPTSSSNCKAAQSTRLQNERAAVNVERRRLEASVMLIRALGGGWNTSSLPQAAVLTSKN